ncbi:MAG: hypothetical protein IPN53_05690 [Comamonadaceae bacterium]|nr:hypothetical protein [Comamonadaceae bacterium]
MRRLSSIEQTRMMYRTIALIFASLLALWGCGGGDSAASLPGSRAPVLNASFDQVSATGALVSWQASEHNQGKSYTFQADSNGAWSAPSSAKIHRYGPEDYGLLSQLIQIQLAWINKTARLTAQLKTEGAVDTGAALTLQMIGSRGEILAWNHMNDARVTQSQGWKSYSIDLKTLPGTTSIAVGVMLEGSGTLWADDIKLEIID